MLKESRNDFVRQRLLDRNRTFGVQVAVDSKGARRMSRARMYTVSSEFKDQLQDLMSRVRVTCPHFVRCIKPNAQLKAGLFDRQHVVEQLRYQGVLQAIEVSRSGFPMRLRHRQGVLEYRSLALRCMPSARLQLEGLEARRAFEQAVRIVFSSMISSGAIPGLQDSDWVLGKTLIFLRKKAMELLGAAKMELQCSSILVLQTTWRRYYGRRRFLRMLNALRLLQAGTRGMKGRRHARRLRWTAKAIVIQSEWRRRVAQMMRARRLRAIAMLQAWSCVLRDRSIFWRIRKMIRRLQRWWRIMSLWWRPRRRWRAATAVQCMWRGFCERRCVRHVKISKVRQTRAGRRLLRIWRIHVYDRMQELIVSCNSPDGPSAELSSSPAKNPSEVLTGQVSKDDNTRRMTNRVGLMRLSAGELMAAKAALCGCNDSLEERTQMLLRKRGRLRRVAVDLEGWTVEGILKRLSGLWQTDQDRLSLSFDIFWERAPLFGLIVLPVSCWIVFAYHRRTSRTSFV